MIMTEALRAEPVDWSRVKRQRPRIAASERRVRRKRAQSRQRSRTRNPGLLTPSAAACSSSETHAPALQPPVFTSPGVRLNPILRKRACN